MFFVEEARHFFYGFRLFYEFVAGCSAHQTSDKAQHQRSFIAKK